ncbi:unnamed protein product [Heterobilharzia americana]|nr:unnamed protein product [Heterobilharzia americana]
MCTANYSPVVGFSGTIVRHLFHLKEALTLGFVTFKAFNFLARRGFSCFREVIHRVPCKPTSLTNSEIPLAFGVPFEPHMGTQMAWFVCPDQATLSSWTNAIMSLLQQGAPTQQPLPPCQPPVPTAAPGAIGFGMPDAAAYGGNPGGYAFPPVQPAPQPNYGYPTGNYLPPSMPPGQPIAPPGVYTPGTSSSYTTPQHGQHFVGQNGQPYQVVYVDGKPKKKKFGGLKNAAVAFSAFLLNVNAISYV